MGTSQYNTWKLFHNKHLLKLEMAEVFIKSLNGR